MRSLIFLSLALSTFAWPQQSSIEAADKAYVAKDYATALPLYRELALGNAKAPRYRYRLGVCRLETGDYERARADFELAKKLGTPPQFADFNLACAWARLGKPEASLKCLSSAVEAGFSDVDQLKSDEDLASIRDTSGYRKLAERVEFPLRSLPGGTAMDHWIGEWTVTSNGQFAGENKITRVMRGFGVTEEWKQGGGPVQGMSLFAYDAGEKCWRHVWTNRDGWTVFRSGRPVKDGIYFEGVSAQPGQKNQKTREWITKRKDGTVRQLIEAQDLKTKKWVVIFDGIYSRKGG